MAQVIWKFPVDTEVKCFNVELPESARFLCVQTQSGKPQMWWLVNPSNSKATNKFTTFGTGLPISKNPGTYLGTWQDGPYVWHLFQEDK